MEALIFYFSGVLISFIIILRHVRKKYLFLTLNDVLIMFFAILFSWLLVLVWALNWLCNNGDKIVIYKFKK
jgi:hypothetical protein